MRKVALIVLAILPGCLNAQQYVELWSQFEADERFCMFGLCMFFSTLIVLAKFLLFLKKHNEEEK